jgi:RND family efflux transporter MFP subunit
MARSFVRTVGWTFAVGVALGSVGYGARDYLADLLPQSAPAAAVVAERPAQPVQVTRVAFAAIEAPETYTGTIRPQHEAPLSFRLPGKLVARLVEVGDRVAAGQIMARLDDTDARLELEAAAAYLAAARTDLARALADVTRNRELFALGHVAQAVLGRADSAAAEAQSRADRAGLSQTLAKNRLSYMELVAEGPGVVTETVVEAGQVVAAGQPVLSVAATDRLDVVFALPEQRRDLLDTATASAVLWAAEGAAYALTLRDISPYVDPVGRTYRVRMTLTNPDAAAALDRTVTVRLATAGGPPAATLPLAAVLNDGAGAAVWRLPPLRLATE